MSHAVLWVLSFSLAAPPVVATVNGEPIPRAELDAALAQRPPVVTPLSAAQERELRQEALTALIDERLIRHWGRVARTGAAGLVSRRLLAHD